MCRRNTLRVARKCAALLHRPAGSDSRLVWLRYDAKVVAYSSDCGWKRFKEALTRCRCSQLAAHLIECTLRPHTLIANRFLGSGGPRLANEQMRSHRSRWLRLPTSSVRG